MSHGCPSARERPAQPANSRQLAFDAGNERVGVGLVTNLRRSQRATLMVAQPPVITAANALHALTICFAPPSAALLLSAA